MKQPKCYNSPGDRCPEAINAHQYSWHCTGCRLCINSHLQIIDLQTTMQIKFNHQTKAKK